MAGFRRLVVVRAALLALTALALALRIPDLTHESAWLDEAFSLLVAQHSAAYIMSSISQFDAHPPLYYEVVHFWFGFFGSGVVQGRTLSLVWGTAAVPLIYRLAADMFDRATGLMAAALLAISPVAIWYSDELRMYAQVGFLALATIFCVWRATTLDARWWYGYVGFGALALYTDYSAGLLVSATALWSLTVGTPAKQEDSTRPADDGGSGPGLPEARRDSGGGKPSFLIALLRGRGEAIMAHVQLCAVTLPILFLMRQQAYHSHNFSWIPAATLDSVKGTLLDLASMHTHMDLSTAVVFGACLLSGCLAFLRERKTRSRQYLLVLMVALVPIALNLLISQFQHIFLTRSVLTALPGLVLLSARGLVWLTLNGRSTARVLGLALAVGVVTLHADSLHNAQARTFKEDWAGVARFLHARTHPGDMIVVDPPYDQLPFFLYWAPKKHVAAHGYPYDDALLPGRRPTQPSYAAWLRAFTPHQTVWLVLRDETVRDSKVPPLLRPSFHLTRSIYFDQVAVARFDQ